MDNKEEKNEEKKVVEPKQAKAPKKKASKRPPKASIDKKGEPKDLKRQEGKARFMQKRNEARAKHGLEAAYSQAEIDAEMGKAN